MPAKLGVDMDKFILWADLSLAELIEKTSEEGPTASKIART